MSEFTYLRSIINETGGTDEDVTARIRKAQSTFSIPMPVWKEKCVRLHTKLRIFNTNVKSTLLYGETWRSTKLLIKKLQTFINKCQRKSLNIRWPEVISNEKLRGRTHQSRIEESIKRRKWKWIGHSSSMKYLASKALVLNLKHVDDFIRYTVMTKNPPHSLPIL